MIKLQDYTPEIYYKESRDFQFIGRLFDIVLNSCKTEADLVYNIPLNDNSNDKLLELLALTLGFKPKAKYSTKQLRAICKVFPEILKNKGSIKSLIIACNALFNAEGLEQSLDYDFTGNDHTELNLYIPQDFGDVILISDLLTYLLPAGMSCNIVRELRITKESMTEIAVDSVFKLYNAGDYDDGWGEGHHKGILYDNKYLAKIPKIKDSGVSNRKLGEVYTGDILRNMINDNVGFVANGIVYKPLQETETISTPEQEDND